MLERFWDWLARRLCTGPFRGDTIRDPEYLAFLAADDRSTDATCQCPGCSLVGDYEWLFRLYIVPRKEEWSRGALLTTLPFHERRCFICGHSIGGYYAPENWRML